MSLSLTSTLKRLLSTGLMAAALSLGLLANVSAQTALRQYTVKAPDGVVLSVQETGNPQGPPVILVHGLLGSHFSWQEQLGAPDLQSMRLIAFDLRGHGQSGSPEEALPYTDGRRWAEDLRAVIEASGAKRPVLVGWSLGAAVISNYLAAHGDASLGGIVYVGGVVELKEALIVPHPEVYRDMTSADLMTRLDAERVFLRLCFERPPEATTFQRLLANAALASFDMQKSVHRMSVDAASGLRRVRKPMLQIYGERDALVRAGASAQRARELNPSIETLFYAETGHAPFVEQAQRFNKDLAAFVTKVQADR